VGSDLSIGGPLDPTLEADMAGCNDTYFAAVDYNGAVTVGRRCAVRLLCVVDRALQIPIATHRGLPRTVGSN
jgi:hypothetical protein